MTTNRPPARLSILFARDAPVAAIIRTGPVKATALIQWNLRNDTFKLGQWVRHKVYAERSALSPDGKHLVYMGFSARVEGSAYPTGFTVISRMPYFTARKMFVECGTWGGGGVFLDNTHVLLRNGVPPDQAGLPDGLKLVIPAKQFAQRRSIEQAAARGRKAGLKKRIKAAQADFDPGAPYVYASGKPAQIPQKTLQRFHDAYGIGPETPVPPRRLQPLPDWCVVRDGCLYRRRESGEEKLLKDFNAMEFEPIAAPYA